MSTDLRRRQVLVRQHAHRALQPQPPRQLVRHFDLGEEEERHLLDSQQLQAGR